MKKNQEYYMILEALGDGVIAVDHNNKVDYVNRKAIEIIGKEPKVKESICDFFKVKTKKKGEIIDRIISEVQQSGTMRGLEKGAYIDIPVKGRRYVSASITRIKVKRAYKVVLSIRDITNLIQLENEHIEQKDNLEIINNALPLGLIVLDKEQKVIKANHFIIHHFKNTDYQVGAHFLGDILKCSNTKEGLCGTTLNCLGCQVRESVFSINQEKESYIQKKVKFKHIFFGQESYRDYQLEFVKIKNHEETQTLIILQDITEQVNYETAIRKAKDDAEEANRLKSEFLSNMSHEIRTPLNGILGMVELTRRKLEDQELIENLDIAKTSSVNLLNIINSILDISKIEAGKFVVLKKAFDFEALLDEIAKENKYKAHEKNILLEIIKETSYREKIISDPIKLKQVLTNLINNAIKFTEVGKVSIRYRLFENKNGLYELKVHVKDTGIGIAQAYKDNIFESFTQVDGSYTRKQGGTGLGLAISKKIITLLEGELEFNSQEGRGSDFFFKIPVELEKKTTNAYDMIMLRNEVEAVNKNEERRSTNKAQKSILVAEDDKVNQKIIKMQLESTGYAVMLADHGKDAIEKFNESIHYDLILMDIQMPIMSGLDAVDIIRQSKKGKTIPIVAITALALKEDRDKILEHNFDYYITKPLELDKLAGIVEALIKGEWIDINACKKNKIARTDLPRFDKNRVMVLDEQVIMMEKLFLEKNYEAFEEEVQVLVDYFDEIQEEDYKLMAFKLIMNIRKEDWIKCAELIDILLYEIRKDINEEEKNENISS